MLITQKTALEGKNENADHNEPTHGIGIQRNNMGFDSLPFYSNTWSSMTKAV